MTACDLSKAASFAAPSPPNIERDISYPLGFLDPAADERLRYTGNLRERRETALGADCRDLAANARFGGANIPIAIRIYAYAPRGFSSGGCIFEHEVNLGQKSSAV
jgi:hypothetical protein